MLDGTVGQRREQFGPADCQTASPNFLPGRVHSVVAMSYPLAGRIQQEVLRNHVAFCQCRINGSGNKRRAQGHEQEQEAHNAQDAEDEGGPRGQRFL